MRPLNGVFAAKCSDRWIGFRSPVSSANPTTSDDLTVLAYLSVIPTCKSSKYKVCRGRSVTAIPSTRYAGRLESVSQHWPFAAGFLTQAESSAGRWCQGLSRPTRARPPRRPCPPFPVIASDPRIKSGGIKGIGVRVEFRGKRRRALHAHQTSLL